MANVKISTINITQGYQQPVNPNADGVVANGFYPQNSTSNDANAGIERATGGELNVKAGGTASVTVYPTSTATALVRIANSSSTAASLQIDAPTNDVQGIVINGASGANNSAFIITGDTQASTAAANIRNFNNGPALRVYAEGSDASLLVVSGGAAAAINATGTVQATTFSGSGSLLTSIPNSATTATNANTASAIVARDASGNFSAGTITAALSGNASTATTATDATNVATTDETASASTFYPAILGATSGNNGARVCSTKLTFVPSTGRLTATSFGGSGAGLTSIPNSATTATSSSTNNAIVARDSIGGFSASVITAAGITVTSGSALSDNVTVTANTNGSAVRVTQTGSGNAILVEDSANPDASPFVVTATGAVAVGTLSPGSGSLVTVAGQIESTTTGYKFPDATTQTTSAGTISRLTSAVTTTSTAFTDITGLTASLATATAYFFEAYLIWQQNNTAGGIGFAINGPGNMGVLDYTIQYQNFANDAAGTIQTVHSGAYDSAYTIPTTTTAANTNYIARISGVLVTTITAGTLALRFKSNNASYTASIRPGSWLLLRRGNT